MEEPSDSGKTPPVKSFADLLGMFNMSNEGFLKLLDEVKPTPPTAEERAQWKSEALERCLRPSRLRVLAALEKQPDSYMGLVERLGIDRPAAMFYLSDLDQAELVVGAYKVITVPTEEKKGMVRRHYSVTREGKTLLKQVREAVA